MNLCHNIPSPHAPRHRWLLYLLLCLATTPVWTSCETVKRFLNTDLEEEDYAMGELYADEYVKEKPFVPSPSVAARRAGNLNALGLERSANDNEQLYNSIQGWMGTPYRYGGTDKNGVDCSAFVGHIVREVYGKELHRVANDIQQDVTPVEPSELRQGDILFFTNSKGRVSHVGIYLKDGLFAHASTSRGVIISRMDTGYWSQHFLRGGRLR